jgi:hypothetical protein
MKLFLRLTILLLVFVACSNTVASAQSGSIRFSTSPITVRQAFEEICEQTGYGIAFNSKILDADRQVKVTSPAPALDSAISQILDGSGCTYVIENGIISIIKKEVTETNRPPIVLERHPQTNDIYVRNLASDFGTDALHRPIVEEPELKPEPEPKPVVEVVVEEPQYVLTSRYQPIYRYAAALTALPRWAIKTNLLYAAGTFTPNLAVEAGLGRRISLQFSGSYNPWHLKGTIDNDKKLVHMILKPELRFWLCERFNGHFFGADLIFARYNISTHDVPMLFEKEHRYDGIAYGTGITYGYHLMLNKRWSLEFALGVGVVGLEYDRYTCATCDRTAVPGKKTYLGPTNAAINLSFLIK